MGDSQEVMHDTILSPTARTKQDSEAKTKQIPSPKSYSYSNLFLFIFQVQYHGKTYNKYTYIKEYTTFFLKLISFY